MTFYPKRLGMMRTLVCASACMALLAPAALAQTTTQPAPPPPAPSRCGDIPATPPPLVDGATANNEAMNATNVAFTAWAAQVRAVMECRRAETEELRALTAARAAEFNTGATQFNQAVAAWQVEVDEFNARPARSRR